MTEDEFIAVIKVDRNTLTVWIESGWLRPEDRGPERAYSDIDTARAQLITDLIGPMGVNAEGVDIILDLVDQLHGLRSAMRGVSNTIDVQPEDVRHRFRAAARRIAGRVREL